MCYCVPPHHEGDTLRTLTNRFTDERFTQFYGSHHQCKQSTLNPLNGREVLHRFVCAFGNQYTMDG